MMDQMQGFKKELSNDFQVSGLSIRNEGNIISGNQRTDFNLVCY